MNKQKVKSRFVQGLIGLLVVLAALMPVNAQSGQQLSVTIPFDFTVGHVQLRAGEYSLRRHTTAPGVLMITNQDEGTRIMFTADSADSLVPRGQARLVFNRYEDQYFLHQIWTTATNCYELPKWRAERSIEKDLALSSLKRIEIVPISEP